MGICVSDHERMSVLLLFGWLRFIGKPVTHDRQKYQVVVVFFVYSSICIYIYMMPCWSMSPSVAVEFAFPHLYPRSIQIPFLSKSFLYCIAFIFLFLYYTW